MAVAMEGGLAKFGDSQAAINLMHEIGKGTLLGRILGNGAALTAQALGVWRVPVVKGQSMPAYEPRAVKGIGMTYATTTMGADHTAGYTIAPEILGVGGKVDPLNRRTRPNCLAPSRRRPPSSTPAATACSSPSPSSTSRAASRAWSKSARASSAPTGQGDDILNIGHSILKTERAFNLAAGLGDTTDRIPHFMKVEPLPPHNTVWDVSDEDLDKVHNY